MWPTCIQQIRRPTNNTHTFRIIDFWILYSLIQVSISILAPIFEFYRIPIFYHFYLFLKTCCHQIPGKSFWIFESNMGLCAKCLGFYSSQFSVWIFLTLPFINKKFKLYTEIGTMMFFFMVADSLFLKFSVSNISRFLFGLIGGLGFSLLITIGYVRWRETMDYFWRRYSLSVIVVVVILYSISIANVSLASENEFVKLRSGTPIMVEFIDDIDGKRYKTNQAVPVIVTRAVKADDHIVILPNTTVTAKVASGKKAGGWGEEGQISVVIESVTAVDGQEILISGRHFSEGDSKHGAATAAGVGCNEAYGTLVGDHIESQVSGCKANTAYSFDGTRLTTTLPMGTCGINYTETDVWRKVSDATPAAVEEENQDGYKGSIGAIIGELY